MPDLCSSALRQFRISSRQLFQDLRNTDDND
jgi:hypothetical protein